MKYLHFKMIIKSGNTRWAFIVFIIYNVYLPFSGYDTLVYDSLEYFNCSSYYLPGNGKFSLLNYSNSLRGYLFPLILLPLNIVSNIIQTAPIYFTRIFGALCAALLFGYSIPELYYLANKTKLTFLRRFALIILTFFLWRDYFNYCLTDFPAILCLLFSLILIFKQQSRFSFLFAGIFLASAINLRPLYLIVMPVYFLAIIIIDRNITQAKLLEWMLIFVLGFGIISLPQFLINIYHFKIYNPFVIANYKQEGNLYLKQLMWGIQYQKYETSIDSFYLSPKMFFLDKDGFTLIEQHNLKAFNNYKNYLMLIWQSPGYFIKSYSRHFFNGIDLQYSTPYIKEVFKYNWFLTWINYTSLFLALIMLKFYRKWELNKKHFIIFIITILPCLVVLPIAIECRFFLPLHLLIYTSICFGWANKWQWKLTSGIAKIKFFVFYLLFISTCYWLSYNSQITLEFGPRILWK